VLAKPFIAAATWVDVDYIDAGYGAGRDANQQAWMRAPQPCDARRIRDCIFITVGRGRAFIGSAWEYVKGAALEQNLTHGTSSNDPAPVVAMQVLEYISTLSQRTFDGPVIFHRLGTFPFRLSEMPDEPFGLVGLAAQCASDELPPGHAKRSVQCVSQIPVERLKQIEALARVGRHQPFRLRDYT
jgi:hypothetical protein